MGQYSAFIYATARLALMLAICFGMSGIVYYTGQRGLGLEFKHALALAMPTLMAWPSLLMWPLGTFLAELIWIIKFEAYRIFDEDCYWFDDHLVRVVTIGDELWVVARDVLTVLGANGGTRAARAIRAKLVGNLGAEVRMRIPGTRHEALTVDGVLEVLKRSNHREARRFGLWLEREVAGPLRRRMDPERYEREKYLGAAHAAPEAFRGKVKTVAPPTEPQ